MDLTLSALEMCVARFYLLAPLVPLLRLQQCMPPRNTQTSNCTPIGAAPVAGECVSLWLLRASLTNRSQWTSPRYVSLRQEFSFCTLLTSCIPYPQLVGNTHAALPASFRSDVNDMAQVPVLEFIDTATGVVQRLTQSVAIIEFLDEVVSSPPLLPTDPLARAQCRQV